MKKPLIRKAHTQNVRDLKSLASELELVKKQAEEYLSGWQRAKADYENLRQRSDDQRAKLIKTATSDLVLALLPVVDNIERALEAATSQETKNNDDKKLKEGVQLVLKQLNEVLAVQGVSRISAVDKSFDPEQHEAIAKIPGKEGICVIEHTAGYKIHDQVLRPCRVSVGTQK